MDLALVNACAGYQRLPKMTRNTVCGMLVLRLLWVKVWFKRICVLREGREEKRRKTSFPLRRRRAPGAQYVPTKLIFALPYLFFGWQRFNRDKEV